MNKNPLFSFLFFFLCFASHLLCGNNKAVNGVLDLSDVEMHNKVYLLEGEWKFYWNRLVSPDKIDEIDPDYFNIPSVWNGGVTKYGVHLQPKGYATYYLKVVLPKKVPEMALFVNKMNSAYQLYYNGFNFLENGVVATSKAEYTPDWNPKTVNINRFNFGKYGDTLVFVLQVANFDHARGGINLPIVLGDRKLLLEKKDFGFSYDLLLCGSLIMGGLFFLGLYLFGKHETPILLFSLICIIFSYWMVASGGYVFHQLFPSIPFQLLVRTEYLSITLPIGLFAIYSYNLFSDEGHKIILYSITVISGILALLALVSPISFFTQFLESYFVFVTLMMLYLSYFYFKAYKNRRVGSSYALISTGVLFFIAFYLIFIDFTSLEENAFISFLAFILFFLSQSFILSYRFAYFLRKAKEEAEGASKAKTDFLGTVSHEMRTPLNVVVGVAEYLSEEPLPKDQKESILSIVFSARHLTKLINDVLDYNKLEADAMELESISTNLRELADSIISLYRPRTEAKKIKLTLQCDQKITNNVNIDSTRLLQVLSNLIDNAIKFTEKGEVKLVFDLLSEDSGKYKVLFKIIDSGIGISTEKQMLIFDRFTQAEKSTSRLYGGTGLGLAIIKKLLALQGSTIDVESQEGVGSTFYFTLALEKTNKSPIKHEIKHNQQKLVGMKVLIVEDNDMNIMVLKKFLTRWEVSSEEAHNGEEAVRMVKKANYDVILMDLQMPIMDGFQASKNIRAFDQYTPIIAMTATTLKSTSGEIESVGMNEYITKPFDPSVLFEKLSHYVN